MSNLALRLIFGAVYVGLMVAGAMLGHPFLGGLLAFLAFLSINEISTLAGKESSQHKWINPLAFAFIIVYLTIYGSRELNGYHLLIAFIVQLACLFMTYKQLLKNSTLNYIFSSLYVAIPLICIAVVFSVEGKLNTMSLLLYLSTIWLYDSMAYVVGKQIGKRPVFPRVSPKKTIEGTIGGAAVTIAVLLLVSNYLHYPLGKLAVLVPVTIFCSIFGDFVESYMKRKLGVKDSGKIMPGHGGILDRLDSIYLSALPYMVILLLM